MATIPRTYMTTSKVGLSSIPLKNGQVISIWDNDEVWYDAPINGERDGAPVRRKISGIRVVSTLPDNPMTDIVYVYIGDHGTLPETDEPIYDLRVWVNDEWLVVGNNWEDSFVKSVVSNDKFYLVGTPEISETVGSLLKNSAVYIQNGELYGTLKGNADSATEADHSALSDLATRAVNDNASTPKPIVGYLNDVSSDATTNLGSTITFTRGDGSSKAIRVSDTTYDVFNTNTAGLVDGTNVTVSQDTTDLILSGSGWIDVSNIVMPTADSANKDGLGQNIANTYIKGLSYDTTTELLTVTQGNDTTSTVSIPDTTYSVFDSSTDGLVPAPSGTGESDKFLRGDHTWQAVVQPSDIYQGATVSSAGIPGLVPAASLGDVDSYLKSDGTWGGTFTQAIDGLVPGPSTNNPAYSLRADGTWDICPDTKNTTGSLNDTVNKLYVIGATTQGSEVVTNSNSDIFIDGSKLFQYDSDHTTSAEVVDESSTQALTNKTYEGYTLGDACEGTIATTVDPVSGNNLPTNSAVIAYTNGRISAVQTLLTNKVDLSVVTPIYDATSTYVAGTYVMYDDGNGARLYRCNTTISTAEAFDPTKWDALTIMSCIGFELIGTLTAGNTTLTLTDNRITTDSMVDYYTDVYGVNPTSVAVTTGQIVLTFAAQATALNVKVVVKS